MSSDKILITGGAGYLGCVLVQKLLELKKLSNSVNQWKDTTDDSDTQNYTWDTITIVDNLMYSQSPLVSYCYREDFNFLVQDVTDHEKLLPLIKEADVIIPLAALVGFPACEKNKREATLINHEHVKFICENKKPDAKILYPNTNSGYGIGDKDEFCTEETPLLPISHYGRTKCAAEKDVLAVGGVAFRLATVFGVSPRMRLDLLVNDFTYKAYNDSYIVLFEHEFRRNFIHVQDVALTFIRGICNYSSMSGEAYNVGLSDANINKLQLAEEIKKFVPNFSINFDEIQSDPDKRDYIVSNKKLEDTGWKPRYSLQSGIVEILKALPILQKQLHTFTNLS